MAGMNEAARMIALEMISILAIKHEELLSSSKSFKFSHVLISAEGKKAGCVDTKKDFYELHGMKYLGLQMFDVPQTNITKYFDQASDFIEEAINSNGRILVHCLMGMSRSATLVLAFLVKRRQMDLIEALKLVKSSRDIRPNDGFLWQLAELELKRKPR